MAAKKKIRTPAKHKWSNSAVSAIHRKALKDLTNRAMHLEEQASNAARNRAAARTSGLADNVRRNNSLLAGMDARLRAVMGSYGQAVPFNLKIAWTDSAHTDFNSIEVNVSRRRHDQCWNADGTMAVSEARRLVASVRGMFYHELGHVLHTVPFNQLLALGAAAEGDLPEETMRELQCRDGVIVVTGDEVRSAWNLIEDQRMEAFLTQGSPQMAVYLTFAVLDVVLHSPGPQQFLFTAGRAYLPDAVVQASRVEWDRAFGAHIPSEEVENLIASYMISTDPVEMLRLSAAMALILRATSSSGGTDVKPGGDDAPTMDNPMDQIHKVGKAIKAIKDAAEDKAADPSKGNTDGTTDNGDAADDGDAVDASTGTNGTGTGSKSLKDTAKELLSELEDALQNDETSKDDIASINGALHGAGPGLPRFDPTDTVEGEIESKARAIVNGIVTAFEVATADSAPHWESEQRSGVLEAVRYRTRQPGDELTVFRSWQDDGEVGQDIHVDLFLDISGSMMSSVAKLGAAAWAVKRACDELNIPCQVTLFNEHGFALYGVDERAGYDIPLIVCDGGTHPLEAFAGALIERKVKHHIVMVMTDGEWSDESVFAQFDADNIISIGFNYVDWRPLGDGTAWARHLYLTEGHMIKDLFEIPRKLEETLLGLV